LGVFGNDKSRLAGHLWRSGLGVINAGVAIIGLLYRPMVVRLGVGVYALALGRRHLSRIGNPDEGQTVADVTLVFTSPTPQRWRSDTLLRPRARLARPADVLAVS
jgi:hypothetical protein